jgi:hypothetical protein
MTDEQSSSFLRQWLDVDISIAQLRQKYVPEVAQVLNGRKTTTFFIGPPHFDDDRSAVGVTSSDRTGSGMNG